MPTEKEMIEKLQTCIFKPALTCTAERRNIRINEKNLGQKKVV